MTKFMIRSMTTTDSIRGSAVTPFHIYLLPSAERRGAYWSSAYRAQQFDSIAAAQTEIDRSLPSCASYEPLYDIVPADDRAVPTFWDARDTPRDARKGKFRVIGNTIVFVEAAVA